MTFSYKYPDAPVRISRSFAAQSMMSTLRAELTEIQPGQVVITSPILAGARQQQGFGHAGLTFSIGDSAAGYAALSLMEESTDVVTAEMKINLLAPATGDSLEAVGTVLRAGKHLMTVQSNIYAITGDTRRHIAIMLGTMARISPRA